MAGSVSEVEAAKLWGIGSLSCAGGVRGWSPELCELSER